MEIRCSVGYGGTNLYRDVKNVQYLLNLNRMVDANFRVHMPENLVMDGDCGQLTTDAIVNFQTKVVGFMYGDARVDPNGKTLRTLNGNIDTASDTSNAPVSGSGIPNTNTTTSEYESFNQGDYSHVTLGLGSKTIKQWGCTLCSLTMAATSVGSPTEHWPAGLLPKDLTPVQANEIAKSGNAFGSGKSSMTISIAAAALGMDYDGGYGRNTDLTSADLARVSAHVGAGKPVLAHVDYWDNPNHSSSDAGDHWILIVQKFGDGSYKALDPSGGGTCTLRPPLPDPVNTRLSERGVGGRTAILAGWPNGSGSTKQKKYNVVRFGLLSRKVG